MIFLLLIWTTIAWLIHYIWNRRHLYYISWCLPGPMYKPFIGNGLSFLCKNEEILGRIQQITSGYEHPMRFWLGPKLIILFSEPSHVEKILLSSKLTYKHEIYDFLKVCLGDGLVSGSGPKWKIHRKLIQPLFDMRFITQQMVLFQENIQICMNKMETFSDSNTFDIHKVIHLCFVDIVGQVIMGIDINSQFGQNMNFVRAAVEMYDLIFTRLAKPWLHPQFLYNLTSTKRKVQKAVTILDEFVDEAINKSKLRSNKDLYNLKSSPILDQIKVNISTKPNIMDRKDFIHHLLTLYAASEDTMSIIASLACVCFGMYPDVQEKAFCEIKSTLNDNKNISMEDISNLKYLDMCVKEVLRLVPIAPFIIRRTTENFQIDKWNIPPKCAILVSIFNLHRDPKLWKNPNHFDPDHFLPEAVKLRHPYAFVPFSAGPRGCIGKLFANVCVKMMLVNILMKFVIEADGKFPDLKLRTDISVRPVDGYNVRLKKR